MADATGRTAHDTADGTAHDGGGRQTVAEGADVSTTGKAAPARPSGGAQEPAGVEQEAAAKIGTGPGRLLLSVYGVFTVAALSRSIVQISTKFHEAPLAYLLSGVAGLVYAVITLALWRGGRSARRVALVCCSAELVGVITVGILTIADSSAFPDATVWSDFGVGYVFLPLLLPVAGLLWLRRAGRGGQPPAHAGEGPAGG